ncbi:MAG TPA: YlxR family protein [Beutenbergiaceae bacterium]|nr:YlxR family protein [Beutenbergiaceae bacterium]
MAPQRDLVRLVVNRLTEPPAVEVDEHRNAPGRGAWVHQHPDCIARTTPLSVKRALRVAEPVCVIKVTAWLEEHPSLKKKAG